MAEEPFESVASCPNPACKSPILSSHPYPWCTVCGERFPENIQSLLPRLQEAKMKAATIREDLLQEVSETAKPVEILGRPLHCVICKHDHFFCEKVDSKAVLAAALLGTIAASRGAYFICAECGYIHWFCR